MYVKFPHGAAKRTDAAAAAEVLYDAVIVGGGISGAISFSVKSGAGEPEGRGSEKSQESIIAPLCRPGCCKSVHW